jgi:S-adenosyl-L-methionine hydrolase (adenosine-forming)
MARPIVFLSDYGLQDEFVGICHGVIERLAPGTTVIDLTHAVPRQDVLRGALLLAQSLRYMPDEAVFLAIVDPGVGTARRPVAIATTTGRFLVGPDNGLLEQSWRELGGVERAVQIVSDDVLLSPLSATFHGRDVFAPAAAALASGRSLEDLGPPIDVSTLVSMPIAEPLVRRGRIDCQVLSIDRFGNVELNVRWPDLEGAGVHDAETLVADVEDSSYLLSGAITFGDLAEGELGLLNDSSGWMAVVLNGASAADALRVQPGDPVTLRKPDEPDRALGVGSGVR